MGIDWFTFFAQIVNFLILVWLLKVFLYKPVLNAMRKREDHIAQRLEDADQKREEAEQRSRELEEKRDEIDRQRDEMLADARDQAEEERKKLSEEGRRHVEQERERWRKSLNREKEAFIRTLRRRAGEQVRDALANALENLADRDLEQSIAGVFADRLASLDDENRAALHQAADEAKGAVTVRSAFDLTDEMRGRVADAIADAMSGVLTDPPTLDWETAPELIAGVQVRVGGYKVAWNLRDHMERIGEDLFRELENSNTANGDKAAQEKPGATAAKEEAAAAGAARKQTE